MLGRKNFTQDELDHARTAIAEQLAAYQNLRQALGHDTAEETAWAALEAFEARLFNNLILVVDRYFVHRLRVVTGKDGNPLNEVEMICDSLMNNDGILRGINVIQYVPEQSVVKLKIGDPIRLTADDFERLASAFFTEIERKFR